MKFALKPIANVRGNTTDPIITVSPTKGIIVLTLKAQRALGIEPDDSLVFLSNVAEIEKMVASKELTAKGNNVYVTEDGEEVKVECYIMKGYGKENTSTFGNKVFKVEEGKENVTLKFTNATAWAELGGNKENRILYKVGAVVEDAGFENPVFALEFVAAEPKQVKKN